MVKKAHLVTGKGGVGKSLFAAALSQRLKAKSSLESQQILLTELTDISFYREYLNLKDINYSPTLWNKQIDISHWSPEECLKEYALHLLKVESLYKLFIENPVTKSLIEVAPGLKELALLGKLTSSPRQHGPPMKYDQIVVDSFSTGHFLSLLRAPSALNAAIPIGPMGEQTKSIDMYVRDPNFTCVHIVCLPEELSVTESIELYNQLKSEFGIISQFYLNRMTQLSLEDIADVEATARESLLYMLACEKSAREELRKAGIQWKELSLITCLDNNQTVLRMAEELSSLI